MSILQINSFSVWICITLAYLSLKRFMQQVTRLRSISNTPCPKQSRLQSRCDEPPHDDEDSSSNHPSIFQDQQTRKAPVTLTPSLRKRINPCSLHLPRSSHVFPQIKGPTPRLYLRSSYPIQPRTHPRFEASEVHRKYSRISNARQPK